MNNAHPAPTRSQLYAQLNEVTIAEERRFRRRLAKARSAEALNAIAADITAASQRVAATAAAVGTISYPQSLPVSARRDDIAQAIADHQVVIVAGETGSGKTTQLPKICLELGRGRRGLIGHTQPRRLAARTVAERIAEELEQPIGQTVGYAIRFDDRVGDNTAIKLMTDGILLAEMQSDRYLNAYDTIIIDEAHERSLNIDFLLGYLKQLLPKRPDLKVIITSATIDPQRFAQHFAAADGTPAPIIEVSGRTYPVEIRYRPLEVHSGDTIIDIDPLDGLIAALEELMAEGSGDILCFFAGERDIRDALEAIEAQQWPGVEATALFGRLSNEEQHRVFRPHRGRRIVLATNIAETSLTVPGIHYVIDTGTARISRYSTRTKVQRLPIEEISQASAQQRSGRCGRVADGIAIRLYSEADFAARPQFTDPEILRTNLAAVILQMISLRLGDIHDFPFVQAPDPKAVRDGLLLLHELGATSQQERDGLPVLSDIGTQLARLPVDPRLGRMLIEARDLGCLAPVIVIVAALTLQDIRERPTQFQAQADAAHARFHDNTSDFLTLLRLWDHIRTSRADLSANGFRKAMKAEFLHYLRIREWFDLVRQLEQVTQSLGWKVAHPTTSESLVPTAARADAIHQAILAGLLSHIGVRSEATKEYHGARASKFVIFPGSAVAKKPPAMVMAGELVETSRLFARQVAGIEASWVERLADNLLKRQYSQPHWSRKRAAVMAYERATLYGVPVIDQRLIPYHRIDPEHSRDLFIRHALVAGEWTTHHEFFHANREKLAQAAESEEKLRRRGLIIDDEDLVDFYQQRIPATVTSGRHFDSWWKKQRRIDPTVLDFDPAALVDADSADLAHQDFPDTWHNAGTDLELRYTFLPGDPLDGVSILIPVPLLASVTQEHSDWLVPGLRTELVTELIRSLPKGLRRQVVPAPEFAARAVPRLIAYQSPLIEQLADILRDLGGSGISAADFRPETLPDHLRMNYAAVDRRGEIIDADRDLEALQHRQAQQISTSVAKAAARSQRHRQAPQAPNRARAAQPSQPAPVAQWTADNLGDIATEVDTMVDGHRLSTYPALEVSTEGITVRVHPTRAAADAAMMRATIALLLREISVATGPMVKGLSLQHRVALDNYEHGGAEGLVNDARVAAVRDALLEAGGPVRSPAQFTHLSATVKAAVPAKVRQAVITAAPAILSYQQVQLQLAADNSISADALSDIQGQLNFLFPQNLITVHGSGRISHYPRYLEAIRIRLADLDTHPMRDRERQAEITEAVAYLRNRLRTLPAGREHTRPVKDILWMIEELRVSLFAQRLGTAHAVSLRRVEKAVDKLS